MIASFYAGPMGCGKTTLLIQDVHNVTGSKAVFTGSEFGSIKSRAIGTSNTIDGHYVRTTNDLAVPLAKGPYNYIFVDEAQFLDEGAVRTLFDYGHKNSTNLRFYGLMSDFRGRPFRGSAQIVALCDNYIRLPGLVPCWCGHDAIMNARVVQGAVVHEGSQILEADIKEADVYYRPLCRKHWYEKRLSREA